MTGLRLEPKPVTLRGVTKRFGRLVAVDRVDLLAEAGRLTTLLGPSGCGKTTTLRMIGGFYDCDEGEILIGAQVVNQLPPHRRSTRTVFQSYALFPHLSVFENVAFGLRATGVRGPELTARAEEALELVGLSGMSRRAPGQLSGGQQQRVAFARALVTRPEVLLLDEPLSNLDAKLRVHMRSEIRSLQRELGITTIYVTHDQEEAMSLSDTVVVMKAGRIEQIGRPHEIYERPATQFVADFIGSSNLVPARIESLQEGAATVAALGVRFRAPARDGLPAGAAATLLIRPEHIQIGASSGVLLRATVESATYLGVAARYVVRASTGERLVVDEHAPRGDLLLAPGQETDLGFAEDRAHLLPAQPAGEG